jgi:microsomal dipeptidase-like Zn-dependent dipeptidase
MKLTALLSAATLCVVLSAAVADDAADARLLERAKQIQKRILTFDCHFDLPFDYEGAAVDGKSQFDLPKAARGQLKGGAIAVWVPLGPRTPEGYAKGHEDAEKKYSLIKAVAEDNPTKAAIAYSPDDVRRIVAQGKFAVVISMLDVFPLGTDVDQLDVWYKRGVRVLGLVQHGHNQWSDSSRMSKKLDTVQEEHGGLSELGKKGVARLNQLGVLIDVSQLSTASFKQVMSLTKAPVIATHSAVKALVDSPRNLNDEELDLLKKNGGVLGVVAFGDYVRQRPVVPAGQTPPPATVAQFVDSIAYAVKKLGIDHVGISSEFNHGGGIAGFQNEGEGQNVTAELLRRGYSEKDIAKLWGQNFLRVWGEAQQAAKSLHASR